MLDTRKIIEKASHSAFHRWVLNRALDRMVPFNKPHGFRIVEVGPNAVRTRLPYRRKNLNHIRGLHACALATVSEFTTGFLLITRLDGREYRLIMQRLEMDYHFQGKVDAEATFTVSDTWFDTHIHGPLRDKDAVVVPCEVKVHDVQGNHLTTGKVYWQIKKWSKVRTGAAGRKPDTEGS